MTSAAAEQASPRSLPQPLTAICLGLVAVGAAAFGYGLTSDPQSAWLAYHSNFMFYATLSQAGVILACIFVATGAVWPGPVRRIAEGLGAWIPVTLVLAAVGYFGGDYLFEWKREGAVHGKEFWLNETRFYVMDLGILAVMTVLSLAFLKASVRPTLKAAAPAATGFARNMIERWTAGWRGDEEEREASWVRTRNLAPLILLLYAFGYSFLAFDQIMSMEQTWFSNLFGVYVIWGGLASALSLTAVIGILHRNSPGFVGQINEKRMHDIGKLIFAFSIFWL
ncbi:MAG: hypothetical protein O7A09_02355, partial [Proteobacteria bacterium]|nr:hypothetical protein [Pseudomonadota bacterium]